jgi:hypothetical protein
MEAPVTTYRPPSPPRPVSPMTMAEARRMVTDIDYAQGFDPVTRTFAWRMLTASRKGQRVQTIIITPANAPIWPEDAA